MSPLHDGGQDIPSLVLDQVSPDYLHQLDLGKELDSLNERLSTRWGIIAPRVALRTVERASSSAPQLRLNERPLGAVGVLTAESVADLLSAHVDQLVTGVLVEYFLSHLHWQAPALVAAVQARFTTNEIVELLRARVRNGQSIRDLAGILDEELSNAVLKRKPGA